MNPIKVPPPNNIARHQPQSRSFLSSLAISTINLSKTAFYSLGFAFSAAIKSPNKQRFKLLIYYHLSKSGAIASWHLFGKHLISPSINIEKKETLVKPIQQEKFDKFFHKIKPVYKKNKPKGKKRTTGVCLGASLNFLKNYLRAKQADSNAAEAFTLAAYKHSNGISEKTCIKHGLQSHTFRENLAGLFQLKFIRGELIENAEEITKKIDRLPYAAYEVSLASNKKSVGHSIVFIKEKDHFFIYDPNFGSAIYPAGEKKILHKLMKLYKFNQIRFNLIELKRDSFRTARSFPLKPFPSHSK